jgi:hypothetical protein
MPGSWPCGTGWSCCRTWSRKEVPRILCGHLGRGRLVRTLFAGFVEDDPRSLSAVSSRHRHCNFGRHRY